MTIDEDVAAALKAGQEADILAARAPEGFKLSTSRGPFTTHNGPYFHKNSDEGFYHGFRAQERHCNSHGIVHGGMLMAFGDGLLATAVYIEAKRRSVTIRMTSDFVHMVRVGEWVEGTAWVTRAARSVCFVEGEVKTGKQVVLRASGVFKLFRK